MLPPKKKSAGLDLLDNVIKQKRKEFSSDVLDNNNQSEVGLSQEELTSQDMSLGNISPETLDILYTSSTEKDAQEFQRSKALKEIAKQKKAQNIENNPILSKVKEKIGEDKTIALVDNNIRLDELEGDTIWGKMQKGASVLVDALSSPLPIEMGVFGINHFIKNKPFTGLTPTEQQEYDKRQTTKKYELTPVLNEVFAENKIKYQELVDKAADLQAQKKRADAQPVFLPDGSVGPTSDNSKGYIPSKQEAHYNTAANHYAAINNQIDDYLSDHTGFWGGLGDLYRGLATERNDLLSIGVHSLKDNIRTLEVKNKADRIEKEKEAQKNNPGHVPTEQLDKSEIEVLKSFATKQHVGSMDLMQGRRLHGFGAGVSSSLVMAEGMLLTEGVGGIVEAGIGKFIAKEAIDLTLKEAMKTGGKVLLKKLAGETAGGFADLSVKTLLTPLTYNASAIDSLGEAEIITDENGNEKVIVGQGRYNYYKATHDTHIETLTNEQTLLNKKVNKSDADNKRLAIINTQIENVNEEFDQIYKPHTALESAWVGYSENMKENFAEKYIGEIAPHIVNNKATRWIAKKTGLSGLGKHIAETGAGKIAKSLSKGYEYTRNTINNLPLGRISGEAIAHTGQMNIIDSVPGEILEEVFTALIPSYKQSYARQLQSLTDFSHDSNDKDSGVFDSQAFNFYTDVVAQTLIMGGGFGGVGMLARANNFRIDKKDIANIYKKIDASVTDKDLAQIIMMNTGNTLYNPAEYDAVISRLRVADKQEEANKLEKIKFLNLAAHAMRTGTVSNFEDTLKRIQSKSEISAETKLNIQLAGERIKDLKKVYDEHNQKDNFGAILTLAERKLANKQTVGELDKKINETKQSAKEEIDAFLARENMKQDYSIDTLLDRQFENEEDQEKYGDFLDKLEKEDIVVVQDYVFHLQVKDIMGVAHNQVMKDYNTQIHPTYAENIRMQKEVSDGYETMFNALEKDNVDNDNLEYNYNNKLIQTPKIVDSIINKLKTQYQGKVDNSVFEELRENKKQDLENQKSIETLQKLQIAKQDIETNREALAEENEDLVAPKSIVVVDDTSQKQHVNHLSVAHTALSGITPSHDVVNNSVLFDPNEFDDLPVNQIYTPEQETAVKNIVKDTVDSVSAALGKQPSFDEYINHVYDILGKNKDALQPNFDKYVKGWELNGLPKDNYNRIYNDMFEPTREIIENANTLMSQMFQQSVPVEVINPHIELNEQTEVAKVEVAKREVVVVGYDEENMPIAKSAITEIDTRRTLTITPKLGFSAIAYEEVIENGVLVKKSVGTALNLNPDSLVDFRDLLNPNMYPTGSTLKLEIAPEEMWSEIQISNGRNEKGETMTISFDKWLKDNNIDRNSKEFRDIVPVFYTDVNGKRLAFVQDTNWYNPYNVGNPFGDSSNPGLPTQEWLDHINEGKKATSALRNSIGNGLSEVTITKPSDGIFYEIPLDQSKITLQEANPQTIIAVQLGDKLYVGDELFNAGKLLNKNRYEEEGVFDLINDRKETQNGNTWEIRQIGLEKNTKGEMIPTFRAYPVGRVVSEEQIETARWAMAAHLHLRAEKYGQSGGWTNEFREGKRGAKYSMTTAFAEQIAEDIFQNTNINIRPVLEGVKEGDKLVNFIKLYFQDFVAGDNFYQYKKGLYAEDYINNVKQHTHNLSLSAKKLKSMVRIDNKGVTSLNQKYDEYLKSTLLTNIKSFNVDTTGQKPTYATAIQPIITVSYNEVAETKTPVYTARQEAVQIVQEQLRTKAPFAESKHIDFLKTLGVNAEDFTPSDDMIINTDKLANIFNVSGNLTITQEKEIRQLIYNKIGNKVSFNYKNKVSAVAIKNDIQSEINLYLNKVESQIKPMLDEVLAHPDVANYSFLVDAYQTTLKNLNDIKANYDEIYNKSFLDIQKQTQLVLNEKQEEDIEQDDVELSVKDYNKDSIEESGKSKSSYRLRRFLSEIPKYDTKGDPQTGYLGIPLYMTFNDVYNELSKTLALGSEVVSSYAAVIDKMKQSNNPSIKDVLTKLGTADQQIKNELVYNFVRHTLSSKFAMYEETTRGISLKVYNTNANEVTRIIAKTWKNNNKSSNLYNKEGSFNSAYAQSLVEEYNSWDKNDYRKVPESTLRNWLGKIGLTFEDNAWSQIYTEGIFNTGKQNSFAVLYTQKAGGLFAPLKGWLDKAIENPEKFGFDENENIFDDMSGVTKSLSIIEAKYNPAMITLSFRDSGKNISTLVPTKYVTDMIQSLKRSLSEEGNMLIDNLQKLSLSENSIILNMLKNEPAFKGMFNISHISLTAFKERGEQPYKAGITDLSDIDYDMVGITGFQDRKIDKLPKETTFEGINMRMANMLFPTMSDKTTGMYLQTAVFDFLKDGDIGGMFEKTEEGITTGIGPTIKNLLFKQLVLPELKRIVKFHTEVKQTNIKDYDKGAQLFHFLPIMNTIKDEDGINIIKKLALTGINIDEAIEKYQPMFEEALSSIIDKEVEFKKNAWEEYTELNSQKHTYSTMFDTKYFTEEGKNPAKDYTLGIYDFVLNTMISNSEVFKVFAGDIANYSKDKHYKKDGKSINPYDITDNQQYISINKEIGINLGKRLALLIAPGSKLAESNDEKYNHYH